MTSAQFFADELLVGGLLWPAALAGWLAWLAGWLDGWLAGYNWLLADWLAGWLAGLHTIRPKA